VAAAAFQLRRIPRAGPKVGIDPRPGVKRVLPVFVNARMAAAAGLPRVRRRGLDLRRRSERAVASAAETPKRAVPVVAALRAPDELLEQRDFIDGLGRPRTERVVGKVEERSLLELPAHPEQMLPDGGRIDGVA